MISLTVENARELLEAGEVYRLGYNCANRGEMFLCFDRIAQCPQSMENLKRIEDEYKNNPQEPYRSRVITKHRSSTDQTLPAHQHGTYSSTIRARVHRTQAKQRM